MLSVPGANEPERLVEKSSPPASAVREALRRILESQPFRTSKQCQDLLRYIVDRSLSGDDASLRERVIGAEVFGRKPTYDTGEDPVVRVRAADVRKRLAQYYQSLGSGDLGLHIELQPGSYLAHFRRELPPHPPQVEAGLLPAEPAQSFKVPTPSDHTKLQRRRFSSRSALAAALFVVAIAGLSGWLESSWKSPQERFWSPFVSAKESILLYIGSNAAYVFTTDFLNRYNAEHGLTNNNGPEFFPDLPANSSVQFSDLTPVRDTFVTMGDLAASVQLATLITSWKQSFVLRSGRDLAFGDLRNRPSVMIGGFNNPWTLELTKNLPYSFRQGIRIRDRDHPERAWVTTPDAKGDTDDYALISRLLDSGTGGPLMTIAGIGQFGTQAAAEFVSSPDRMRDLLKSAPHGWQNKNMQAVLHIKVVGYTPVKVEVVAIVYW
jgi:hypothetical protein